MLKLLKGLLGVVQRDDLTAADITTSLAQADAEVTAAANGLEAAEKAYRDGLLVVEDDALARLDAARTTARLRADRANAVRAALGEKQVAAAAREDEARRQAAYDAAATQAAEARAILVTLYPGVAADLVKIITAVASAEAAVAAVNADLPEGAPKILPVEGTVRNAGRGRTLASTRIVHLWCRKGERMPGSLDQARVETDAAGNGFLRPSRHQVEYLIRRKFREIVYEEDSGWYATPLAETVNLPGLTRRSMPFWRPMSQGAKPEWILDEAEKLTADGAAAVRRDPNPTIRTELELLDHFDSDESARPGPGLMDALNASGADKAAGQEANGAMA